jgi:hypothetical protein
MASTAELALAAAAEPHPFASLGNPLTVNANAEFAMTDDYAEAVRTIWSSVA